MSHRQEKYGRDSVQSPLLVEQLQKSRERFKFHAGATNIVSLSLICDNSPFLRGDWKARVTY